MNGVDKLVGIICSEWDIHPERIASLDDKKSLIRIATDLDALYRDKTVIREWIDEKAGDLAGISPRAAIASGDIKRVESYVVGISGR
jgi:hypothetical protein